MYKIRNDGTKEPLGFYSSKLSPTQQKYSTYDRELLAIYSAVKYFRHLVEGRKFTAYTDHKPLIFALKQNPEKATPRQFRYLDLIAQYTTDIRYIQGDNNQVADALSRIDSLSETPCINIVSLVKLEHAQKNDQQLQSLFSSKETSLNLHKIPYAGYEIICDVSPSWKYTTVCPFSLANTNISAIS